MAAKHGEQQGFTLIELMIVVLIIGILIAIALPTFLGARTRAQDRAAQASLRNAAVAAQVSYSDTSDFSGADPAGLDQIEPSLVYLDAVTASSGPGEASVAISDVVPGDSQAWSGATLSESGTCFYILNTAGTTTYGTGSPCTGTDALAAADQEWP